MSRSVESPPVPLSGRTVRNDRNGCGRCAGKPVARISQVENFAGKHGHILNFCRDEATLFRNNSNSTFLAKSVSDKRKSARWQVNFRLKPVKKQQLPAHCRINSQKPPAENVQDLGGLQRPNFDAFRTGFSISQKRHLAPTRALSPCRPAPCPRSGARRRGKRGARCAASGARERASFSAAGRALPLRWRSARYRS